MSTLKRICIYSLTFILQFSCLMIVAVVGSWIYMPALLDEEMIRKFSIALIIPACISSATFILAKRRRERSRNDGLSQ